MLNAFRMESTLNKNGSFPSYFLPISMVIKAWLSCKRSRSVRCDSTSFEGKDGCVPIHSSAYGFSDSMESWLDGVAEAYFAAAEDVPTLPTASFSDAHEKLGLDAYPSHSY